MKQIIHIFGASGSGTSTLGRAICRQTGYRLMDTDDYYWLPTDPMFTAKRSIEDRLRMMQQDIDASDNVVISGSLTGWGDPLMSQFTFAIRLVTPTEVRMERLKAREYARFGSRILPGGDMYDEHQEFLAWAASYDTGDIKIRSKAMHDAWQQKLSCQLITLSGTMDLAELTTLAVKAIPSHEHSHH